MGIAPSSLRFDPYGSRTARVAQQCWITGDLADNIHRARGNGLCSCAHGRWTEEDGERRTRWPVADITNDNGCGCGMIERALNRYGEVKFISPLVRLRIDRHRGDDCFRTLGVEKL